ncbi:hypothetical protein KM043_001801 [Ampulex compressa]|nr:hypothetical protein KM043_001801 [Ampulex compressa]
MRAGAANGACRETRRNVVDSRSLSSSLAFSFPNLLRPSRSCPSKAEREDRASAKARSVKSSKRKVSGGPPARAPVGSRALGSALGHRRRDRSVGSAPTGRSCLGIARRAPPRCLPLAVHLRAPARTCAHLRTYAPPRVFVDSRNLRRERASIDASIERGAPPPPAAFRSSSAERLTGLVRREGGQSGAGGPGGGGEGLAGGGERGPRGRRSGSTGRSPRARSCVRWRVSQGSAERRAWPRVQFIREHPAGSANAASLFFAPAPTNPRSSLLARAPLRPCGGTAPDRAEPLTTDSADSRTEAMRAEPRTVLLLCALLASLEPAPCAAAARPRPGEGSANLGDSCRDDAECERGGTVNGRCLFGRCRCLPFFARYNQTHCLESSLLGHECVLKEQCSMRVANSECIEGICGCEKGRVPFRRHTCLGPAKLGDVCYGHAHCRLWEINSHCDFLIPDLFGRCQCTAPMRREKDVCGPDELVRPVPLVQSEPPAGEDGATGVRVEWLKNATSLPAGIGSEELVPVSLVTRPATSADGDELEKVAKKEKEGGGAEAEDDEAIVVEAEGDDTGEGAGKPGPAKTERREPTATSAVSLGLGCTADLECRLADSRSRCVEGVCDCVFSGNGSCSARSRGCAPGTFQCRASGRCVSWFFVCDGRPDCADGSDEECSDGQACPAQAFRCYRSNVCVSKAALCNGKRDCPNGEDELGCKARRGCPAGAFGCDNGQCLPAYEFCNAVVSCRDGSDEPRAVCGTRRRGRAPSRFCPFRCDNGRCRSDAIACSGRDGCGDGSDEKRCSVCECPATPGLAARRVGHVARAYRSTRSLLANEQELCERRTAVFGAFLLDTPDSRECEASRSTEARERGKRLKCPSAVPAREG